MLFDVVHQHCVYWLEFSNRELDIVISPPLQPHHSAMHSGGSCTIHAIQFSGVWHIAKFQKRVLNNVPDHIIFKWMRPSRLENEFQGYGGTLVSFFTVCAWCLGSDLSEERGRRML
jgi:hypothetical protein